MMNHLKYYQTRAFLSRSFTFSSTKHPKPLSKILPFHHFHTNSISPTKTHLYASFFCTLIHLYLTCGRLSKATDTFYDMIRTHHIVPTLPLWNRLIYQFNATGLVSQNCYANLLVHGTWRHSADRWREREALTLPVCTWESKQRSQRILLKWEHIRSMRGWWMSYTIMLWMDDGCFARWLEQLGGSLSAASIWQRMIVFLHVNISLSSMPNW